MDITLIGLGKMGSGISERLMRGGHSVSGYDESVEAVESFVAKGGVALNSLSEIAALPAPRTLWVMLPAGGPTNDTLRQILTIAEPGDRVIDGGNSRYQEAVGWAGEFLSRGIHFLDVGVSGGVWGLAEGYCLMIGGEASEVEALDPIFKTLAPAALEDGATPADDGRDPRPSQGYMHCGPVGSGHFVKMIHNGIEYGMMQAYAEGFDVLKNADHPIKNEAMRYDLNLADIAEVWRHGSVVRSWLLDLGAAALKTDPDLDQFDGHVSDSGEARWTLQAAIEEEVATPVIAASLFSRFRSRVDNTFGEKLLSAFRNQFGGHNEPK